MCLSDMHLEDHRLLDDPLCCHDSYVRFHVSQHCVTKDGLRQIGERPRPAVSIFVLHDSWQVILVKSNDLCNALAHAKHGRDDRSGARDKDKFELFAKAALEHCFRIT